jgi:hypothetical protein
MESTAIKSQIERLLHSQELAGKDQLKKLLEFLFEKMDSQASLKPIRVIEELWPGQVDTKNSADLATEISRLRRALEIYYSGPGKNDPVLITLPNRAASGSNGSRGSRWITAEVRPVEETPVPPVVTAASPAVSISLDKPSFVTPTNQARWIRFGLAILSLAAVFALPGYIGFRALESDRVPQSARVDGLTLSVMNAKGQELWRKSFPQGLWNDYYNGNLAARIWFGDLDGDGHIKVLFLYHPSVGSASHSTTLICYSDRGEENWRWTPGKPLPEIAASPVVYETLAFAVTKPRPGTPSRIVLSSYHHPYYPNQIAVLDSHGTLLGDYWHSGHLDYMILADIDGDGREEIVASGISNGYRQATLIVLDLNHVFGASEEKARPELQLHGMIPAKERLRILFPRSDLNRALFVYNRALEASVKQGRIQIDIRECQSQPDCDVFYEFDKGFNLLSVKASDSFVSAHTEFYSKAKVEHRFTKMEEDEFRRVNCLAGCGSVGASNEGGKNSNQNQPN